MGSSGIVAAGMTNVSSSTPGPHPISSTYNQVNERLGDLMMARLMFDDTMT